MLNAKFVEFIEAAQVWSNAVEHKQIAFQKRNQADAEAGQTRDEQRKAYERVMHGPESELEADLAHYCARRVKHDLAMAVYDKRRVEAYEARARMNSAEHYLRDVALSLTAEAVPTDALSCYGEWAKCSRTLNEVGERPEGVFPGVNGLVCSSVPHLAFDKATEGTASAWAASVLSDTRAYRRRKEKAETFLQAYNAAFEKSQTALTALALAALKFRTAK